VTPIEIVTTLLLETSPVLGFIGYLIGVAMSLLLGFTSLVFAFVVLSFLSTEETKGNYIENY